MCFICVSLKANIPKSFNNVHNIMQILFTFRAPEYLDSGLPLACEYTNSSYLPPFVLASLLILKHHKHSDSVLILLFCLEGFPPEYSMANSLTFFKNLLKSTFFIEMFLDTYHR